jgi:hypothetical protein
MESTESKVPELLPREKGFIRRIVQKYPEGRSADKNLSRSLAIFCLMIVAAHVIERIVPATPSGLSWWLPLLIILPVAGFMFTRYRKFSIFRSCVLSKVAARLAQYEDISPPKSKTAHPHAARRCPEERGARREQPAHHAGM